VAVVEAVAAGEAGTVEEALAVVDALVEELAVEELAEGKADSSDTDCR